MLGVGDDGGAGAAAQRDAGGPARRGRGRSGSALRCATFWKWVS